VTAPQAGQAPLARLLAMAYRSLITDLHSELRHRGWTDVRPVYGFVLLALRTRPIPSGALSELLGVTKQATSKLVEEMAAAGYLTKTVGTEDARQKPLILTDPAATCSMPWSGSMAISRRAGERSSAPKRWSGCARD
jgi:DNA-binding MarR family transcriptional regulator